MDRHAPEHAGLASLALSENATPFGTKRLDKTKRSAMKGKTDRTPTPRTVIASRPRGSAA
jgi:hypothetical protein